MKLTSNELHSPNFEMSNFSKKRVDCRLCHSINLELVLKLTPTPPANELVTREETQKPQDTFPLDIFFCKNCFHVQLLEVVDPSRLFKNYVYVSGTSKDFVKHFETYANNMISRYGLNSKDFVFEIGSNDGTLLSFFKTQGLKILGIDPAERIGHEANQKGIPTLIDFFNSTLAAKVVKEHGLASLIVANNVYAHIDDIDSVTEGIKILLKDEGVFTFEVSYLKDVFEKTLFDTMYHEHLCYHSVISLQKYLDRHQMKLIMVEAINTHGGSIRVHACKKVAQHATHPSVGEFIQKEHEQGFDKAATFHKFNEKINKLGDELVTLLKKFKSEGKKIAAFGLPAKATTLMYHFKIGPEYIDYVVDDNPLKQNLFSPGFHIPIYPSSQIKIDRPDYLVILAWNFADYIIKNNQDFLKDGGHFIVPLPEVKVI